jgi:hypothetical protein
MLIDFGSPVSAERLQHQRAHKRAGEDSSMKLRRPENDKRLGVPLGILWGLALSVLLWALIRWALGTAIMVLHGI